jgi:hypothetical protein
MADKELTLEELQAENESLRKKAESLEQAVKNGKETGKISEPVPGSFDVEWKHPQTGKKVTRKVEFKDGRLRSVLPKVAGMEQLAGMYVANESLLLIANGKEAKPEHLAQNPALLQLDQEKAAAVLLHFAAIDAGFLK